MARRRALLVGASELLGGLSEYLDQCLDHHAVDVESVRYCEDALLLLRRKPLDLVLVLGLNAPWRTWSSLSVPTIRYIGSRSAIMFLKQLRGLPTRVPVFVVSGNMRAEVQLEALANGAFAFVPWPIDGAEFDRLLELALGDNDKRAEGL